MATPPPASLRPTPMSLHVVEGKAPTSPIPTPASDRAPMASSVITATSPELRRELQSPAPPSALSTFSIKLEQGTVKSLVEENGTIKGVLYKTKSGKEIETYAPLTIVCDGSFSNLRRSLCTSKIDVPSFYVGLVLENCEFPCPNYGHVIIADPTAIAFYPISSTESRCLVDVPEQKVPSISTGEMANYLKTVVVPQLPSELHDAFLSAIDRGSIRTMPNKSMPAAPHHTPGALLLGDACNMRLALTGRGMTVALSDIVVLRNLLRPLGSLHGASSVCRYLESFYTLRKPVSSTINTLAGALSRERFSGDSVRAIGGERRTRHSSRSKMCNSA